MNKKYPLMIVAFLLTVTGTWAAATTFTDEASFASWYKDAVKQMQTEGVISGYADGSFKGENPVSRGELSLMLQRYGTNVVDKKIAAVNGNSGSVTEAMVDKKIKDYFLEHQGGYFDSQIQRVIDNTLGYEKTDYDYKPLLIMAESGLKQVKAPDKEKLEQKEAKLPAGYTLYKELNTEQIQDDYYPPYYLNYNGTESNFMGEYDVDYWYGPFDSNPF